MPTVEDKKKLADDLKAALIAAASESWLLTMNRLIEQGGYDAGIIESMQEQAQAEIEGWAGSYAVELVSNLDKNAEGFVRDALNDYIGTGKPMQELVDKLAERFGPVHGAMIAQTEVTAAVAQGALVAMAVNGVGSAAWMTMADERLCEDCMSNESAGAVPVGGTFPSGHDAPPAHVNCRCWLQPAFE